MRSAHFVFCSFPLTSFCAEMVSAESIATILDILCKECCDFPTDFVVAVAGFKINPSDSDSTNSAGRLCLMWLLGKADRCRLVIYSFDWIINVFEIGE